MLAFFIGLLVGGIGGVVVMALTNIAHHQSELEDPTRRKSSKAINETCETTDVCQVAAYIAQIINDKQLTASNLLNMMFLCQAHFLAWNNRLLFPVYFWKHNNELMLCDRNFMWCITELPSGKSLNEYLIDSIKEVSLSETAKTDIELALARHIHADLDLLVKENPAFINAEENDLISYRQLRNSYRVEDEKPKNQTSDDTLSDKTQIEDLSKTKVFDVDATEEENKKD